MCESARIPVISALAGAKAELAASSRPIKDSEVQALGALELEHLEALLARLPERTRDVFMLCRVEGMTHKETARYLRISTSSVQKHMAMALAKMGRALDPGPEG